MSNSILVLGESGCGKSTAIRTLPPEHTFIVNVIKKPLPFRGYKNHYKPLSSDGTEGNYYETDDPLKIMKVIRKINNDRPEINYLIIDDFGYTLTNAFMRKAMQKGYDKYSEIGSNAFYVLEELSELRDDLYAFVMMHTELDNNGKSKPRTVGKMVDQYVCIEGKFTYVLHALITDAGYVFLTNNDGQHIAKTSLGMFKDLYIPNDLLLVANTIKSYNEEQ